MPNLLSDWECYTKDFESPDLLVSWGFYSLISAHLQRRVWLSGNSDLVTKLPTHNSIFLNQFVVFVAPPAAGKTRITSNVKGLCEHPENKRVVVYGKDKGMTAHFDAVYCSPDSVTFEGLFQLLNATKAQDSFLLPYTNPAGEKKEAVYSHNSMFSNIEELGVMFSKNTEDVTSFMTQAYDARNMSRHTKTAGSENIQNVCVNFLAGTTVQQLARLSRDNLVAEGLSTRCIFVYAAGPRFYRDDSIMTPEKEASMRAILKHCNTLVTKVMGEVSFTPEAREFMRDYYESGKLRESERTNFDVLLDGYYGRKKLHWRKLSAAMWFGMTESFTIDSTGLCTIHPIPLEVCKSALALLNKTEVSMHLCFREGGDNYRDEIAKEILMYLRTNGITSTKKLFFNVYRLCKGGKPDFDDVINYMTITEQVLPTGNGFQWNEKCPLNQQTTIGVINK